MYNIYILTRLTVESKVNIQVSCGDLTPGHVPLPPKSEFLMPS